MTEEGPLKDAISVKVSKGNVIYRVNGGKTDPEALRAAYCHANNLENATDEEVSKNTHLTANPHEMRIWLDENNQIIEHMTGRTEG